MTIDFVKGLACRLKCPNRIEELVRASSQSSAWSDSSLSHGFPSHLLLFTTLDELYPDEGWDEASHAFVIKIKELIESGNVENLSLFGGLAGCCFAIQAASKGNKRYQKLIIALNQMLFEKGLNYFIQPLQEKWQLKLPFSPQLYDPISGITGLSIVALQNQDLKISHQFLEKALKLCIAITEDLSIGSYKVPGWYVPRHYQFIEEDKKNYPKGNFNLGLAHGIPSVLALLSIAYLQGIVLEGQKEAIQIIVDWLQSKKKMIEGTVFWENRCSFEEEVLKVSQISSDGLVEGWCYGTPGVARVLYLAGKALKNIELQKLALGAFLGLFSRIDIKNHYLSPTFCHGLSGVLTIGRLMARDSGSIELAKWNERVEGVLLTHYHPSSPFGFKEIILDFFQQKDKTSTIIVQDNLGILSGSSGVLLSLLTKNIKSLHWTKIFLIEETIDG